MEFAIVRFTSEEDVPGIISTRWIDSKSNSCWFPNVRTERRKNKLMIAHASPEKDWVKYPVKILRKFSSYHSAKSHLQEEEATSNLESGDESLRPLKKKRKNIPCPGEDSSCGIENGELNIKSESHIPLLTSSLNSSFLSPTSNSTSFQPDLGELPVNQSSNGNDSNPIHASSYFSSADFSYIQELNDKIETIANNQRNLLQVMEDLVETSKRIEQKLDWSATNSNNQDQTLTPEDEEDIKLISSLPLGTEDFLKFDRKIADNSNFKKRLLNACMTVEGRDLKVYVCNLMRKFIVDEVGEEYSLTGKSTEKNPKKSFEKTETYKFILEICYRSLKVVEVSIIRGAISDWLMQAKFRRTRRAQRSALER